MYLITILFSTHSCLWIHIMSMSTCGPWLWLAVTMIHRDSSYSLNLNNINNNNNDQNYDNITICRISHAFIKLCNVNNPGKSLSVDDCKYQVSYITNNILPGMSGNAGRPPVAMRMCFPVYFLPSTSTQRSFVNLAQPRIKSTLLCRRTKMNSYITP